MTKTKFCKTCGKIMWDVQPTKRYCDSCIRKRNIKSGAGVLPAPQGCRCFEKRQETRCASLPEENHKTN